MEWMCHTALRKNKRNLSDPKWKDFIIEETLNPLKSTTNLLASVLLGLVTVPTTNKQIKIQYISAPKCTISVPYNLTVWEHSGSAPHELQELAVGRQQHMGTPHPPLTGDSWQLLSHSTTFQNGRTPSECDNIWDFSVNNWDLAANKSEWFNELMFKVPLGTRGAQPAGSRAPRSAQLQSCWPLPNRSSAWNTPLTSRLQRKAPARSETELPSPAGLLLRDHKHSLISKRSKDEADESQCKYLSFLLVYFVLQKGKQANKTSKNKLSSPVYFLSHLIKGMLCYHLIQWKNSFRSPWERHWVYDT